MWTSGEGWIGTGRGARSSAISSVTTRRCPEIWWRRSIKIIGARGFREGGLGRIERATRATDEGRVSLDADAPRTPRLNSKSTTTRIAC